MSALDVILSPTNLDADMHRRESIKGDLATGNLPQDDSKAVHISSSLVHIFWTVLESYRGKKTTVIGPKAITHRQNIISTVKISTTKCLLCFLSAIKKMEAAR